MNIHTTQNLNSFGRIQSTNKLDIPEIIRLNYSEHLQRQRLLDEPLPADSMVAFKGKANPIKDGKKVVKSIKKVVGEIKKDPAIEKEKGDRLLKSSFFNALLKVTDFETVATATIAAVACAARSATIAAMPSKEKSKEDNIYAASQALASGIVGFITAFALTAPFKAGANYTRKKMMQTLDKKVLEGMHPQLKGGVIDKNGSRILDMEKWIDNEGHAFTSEIKMCDMLPKMKQLSEISDLTFQKLLGVNVDWAANKGKSFNDVVLKDGRKLYDAINMSRLGIVVEEKGMKDAQILLKDLNKEYLINLVKDAKGTDSIWKDLDVNSVYDASGKVVDFRQWKNVKGKQWKLDLDSVSVSSAAETANYSPRVTGKRQFDKKENIYKYTTYQRNGVDGGLGTEITPDMVESERSNVILDKLLTWGPDLVFRIPLAAGTVALIPWVLKNVFGIQKSSAKKAEQQTLNIEKTQDVTEDKKADSAQVSFKGRSTNEPADSNSIAFKGKDNWFVKGFGKFYGKPLLKSKSMWDFSKWLIKVPGEMTQHMVALGSLITSGTYVQRTLTNKELDPNRRRTLAINQGLCFLVPTAAAYYVDKKINSFVKNKEYRYTGLNLHNFEMDKIAGKVTAKQEADFYKSLGKKAKGIRILASLSVFTLIYRYATPVLITPIANKIGDFLNAKIEKKRQAKAAEALTAKALV